AAGLTGADAPPPCPGTPAAPLGGLAADGARGGLGAGSFGLSSGNGASENSSSSIFTLAGLAGDDLTGAGGLIGAGGVTAGAWGVAARGAGGVRRSWAG